MENFITAATFNHPHETAIIRHLLTDAGLSFYFENEIMSTLYTTGISAIRLKVHINDLDTVNEILDTLNGTTLKIV